MIDAKKKITFIVNPISGTGSKEKAEQTIEACIDSAQFDWRIIRTEYAGHASVLARQCADEGDLICAAVGGDGTVNEVARALVHTDTALGIVPCGSGNGLARHLCMPMNIRQAVEIINKAKIESFDYGLINNLPFFCTCGMGFDAFISMKFSKAGKRGPITYVENVLKEGLNYKPDTYYIEDETGTVRHKAFLIACANASQYGNNAYIAPGASMKDGLLDIIIMEPFNALDAPQLAIDLFNKTIDKHSKIKTFKARKIHIHRESEGAIHYDGDPIITGCDIDVELIPLGIKIVTNPDATEDDAQPNYVQNAFSDFFNNINNVREDISRNTRRIQAINKLMLRRLSRL